MKPHAFVTMPFGIKKDSRGAEIDFNRVYAELIKPALEAAGLDVFRADEEMRAGEIRKDMFQELLIADLVVADLTLDNPNVWYELGVRHALRARGVVLVQGPRSSQPFDIYTDRKLRYSVKDHGPDPATLDQDRAKLTAMATTTMESWHGRKISPVYDLVSSLQEPDWKSLRVGNVLEFWERHEAWEQRLELAQKAKQIGDVLVLADEAPIAAFRAEAWVKAGETLRKGEHFTFGLEQLDRGLAIEPHNLRGLQEKGVCLQRLAVKKKAGYSLDRARAHYRDVLEEFPDDPETWALLGRLDKDAWVSAWKQASSTPEQMKDEAAYEGALLRAAIESYATAYRRHPGHYYSGINALTLMHLYQYLTHDAQYGKEMVMMAGAVQFAAACERDEEKRFWSLATLGDLEILIGTPSSTKAAYQEAITKNEKDWFALSSSLAQLELLKQLGFQLGNVEAGLGVFERALKKLVTPQGSWQPKQVFLFSGHMIDKPGRQPPRFPLEKESLAAKKIAEALEKLQAGPEDLALTQGACGGDVLFTEACQQRGVKVQWLQPFDEPTFIKKSVTCRGEDWRGRYLAAKGKLVAEVRSATESLGPPPKDVDPYERCNLWLLYTALSYGIRRVQFVCLWDGGGGDGPGGTAHMYQEVNRRTGQVTWIDSRTL
ncbi:MAG: toll/interleukin-1 receptor domain-containing protein [Nitrospira sp.]|nr:toll/interleukin-1 receptor domain-containing protein [Nitrospira sp.]MDR4470712.1 toll/interleukin-1 receptor domain-containing protein [Nitrospira sp.]